MESLREKLFGKMEPLREKLAVIGDKVKDVVAPANTIEYTAPPAPKEAKIEVVPKSKFDKPKLMDAIAYNETRGQGTDEERYKYSRHSGKKELGDALGKYQVTEGELKTYAPMILGKNITREEFQNDPKLQEEYMQKKIDMIERDAPDATPEEIMALHRYGLAGRADPEVRKEKMQRAREYIDSGMGSMKAEGDVLPTELPQMTPEQIRERRRIDTEQAILNSDAVIKQYNPTFTDKIKQIADKFKDKIPFMDTEMEKAVRTEVINAYPLKPEAQKVFEEVNMKFGDTTHKNASGEYNPLRGKKTAKVLDKTPSYIVEKLPNKIFGTLVGEHMTLKEADADTAMHEGFHSFFQRSNWDTDQFLRDWVDSKIQSSNADQYGPIKMVQEDIESNLNTADSYSGISDQDRANEMFAFLGARVGAAGLDAIPDLLQKYYEPILMSKGEQQKKWKGEADLMWYKRNDLTGNRDLEN